MKSTVQKSAASADVVYPCLMIQESQGRIVYFSQEGSGTQLNTAENRSYGAGIHTHKWAMECFVLFHGTVTLEND